MYARVAKTAPPEKTNVSSVNATNSTIVTNERNSSLPELPVTMSLDWTTITGAVDTKLIGLQK